MLWTAISALPSRSASSISLTKRPLPPTFARGTSSILSPVVLILLSSISIPGASFSRPAFTHSACHKASALPRVPIMILVFIVGSINAVKFLYHCNEFISVFGIFLKRRSRRMDQLIDNCRCKVFNRFQTVFAHIGTFCLEFFELFIFYSLSLLTQCYNCRDGIQRGHPF